MENNNTLFVAVPNVMENKKTLSIFSIPVLVAALGFFVDIYDLLLFSIVRKKSLQDIGLSAEAVNSQGLDIIGKQMLGLMIGGIIWGMLGDKKGRLSVLFGSILLYSLANIANGFVVTPEQYSLCRFIAGVGLAGELGAGVTLVSELLSKEKRGIATSLIAGIGCMGAVFAYFIAYHFSWQNCYFIGGGLGLCLLLLRVSVFESGMFKELKDANVQKGNFLMFFTNGQRFKKYLMSILIGLPTWYVSGILVAFSDKFAHEFKIQGDVDPAQAVLYHSIAFSIGDLLSGLLSHVFKSRKKAICIFYGITIIGITLYFTQTGSTVNSIYLICALMGFGTGFWAICVTMAAEQFGTNLRATAATTVPNMIRGSLPLLIVLFKGLQPSQGYINAALITGVLVMIVSIIAVFFTEETYGKDLSFLEI